jgi:transcriptional regulator NrdR family protein
MIKETTLDGSLREPSNIRVASIVKRRGHRENFDERKLYASIYGAAEAAFCDEASCERLAGEVTEKVKGWLKSKKSVDSFEIHERVKAELAVQHEEVSFFYDRHLPNLRQL